MCSGWCNNWVTRQHARCNNENTNRAVVESWKNSLNTESLHAYQTANPMRNSWYWKFPRHKRASCYWIWHVILRFFNYIVAFNQGLSWLMKNVTTCGERTIPANVFYDEVGVIILERIMFGTVSTSHITIYTKPCACRTTWAMGLFRNWSRHSTFASIANLCYLRWRRELRVCNVFQHKWFKIL